MEKLTVGKDPSEIHEKSSLYNNTLFKTFTTWSAISKDGRRVFLTACDMSSVHCLMQILTAFFFFIFWCLRVFIYVTSEMPSNDKPSLKDLELLLDSKLKSIHSRLDDLFQKVEQGSTSKT